MGPDSGTGWSGLEFPLFPAGLRLLILLLRSELCRHTQFRTIILVWKIFSNPTGVCVHYTRIVSHITISRDHRRQDPPRKSQCTHRIRGRAAGSRLLTCPPKPSNALQLQASPSRGWLHLVLTLPGQALNPCVTPSRSSLIWQRWPELLVTWLLNKPGHDQVPTKCAHSCLNTNLCWRKSQTSFICTPWVKTLLSPLLFKTFPEQNRSRR